MRRRALPEPSTQPSPSAFDPDAYRLIAFDFDGTLADSFPHFLGNLRVLAARHGFRAFDEDELQVARGLGSRELMARAGVPMWKLPLIVRDFRRLMAAQTAGIAPFDGVAAALGALHRRGATLAIVTSNAEANVRAVLGNELAGLFAHVECGVPMFGKTARLRRLARRTGADDAALYVGDELRDAEAAAGAGYAFGAVGWGYTLLPALQAAGPRHVFLQPRELAGR